MVADELKKLLASAEKSESDPEPAELSDEDDDAEFKDLRSGAV